MAKQTRAQKIEALRARHEARQTSPDIRLRLSVPESAKNPDLEYRWINDDGKGRVHDKTNVDTWDFVESAELGMDGRNTSPGDSRISRVVGTREDGTPLHAYLVCKPKEWHQADRRRKTKEFRELQDQIRKGVAGKLADDAEHAYVPREAKQVRAARAAE